jgi:ABC-type phosphate/phosphonate transport system substrate-binding protein
MKLSGLAVVGWSLLTAVCHGAGPEDANAETAFTSAAPGATPAVGAELPPLVLKIAVNDIYCRKTACDCIGDIATRSFDGVLAELKTRHHITLEFTYFMEMFDLDKAIQAKRFDGVLSKPWTALRFAAQTGANFKRLADLLDPDNQALMTGMVITTNKSPLRSLEDLQGKRLALGQADSYEKYQAPLQLLAAKRIKSSSQVCFSSCGENLDALMAGKVDAAVISSYAFTASCAVDFAKPEDFRVIAKTPEMPLTSLLVDLNKISAVDAARLQAALVAVSGDKVPKDLVGKGFVMPASWRPAPTVPTAKPTVGKFMEQPVK